MTKDEALKMAIEALNDSLTRFSTFNEMQHDAIQACKDALEQPTQEPVAWLSTYSKANEIIKTYPAPSWQALSDDEIAKLNLDGYADEGELDFARAIEQELKTKNGFSELKEKNT